MNNPLKELNEYVKLKEALSKRKGPVLVSGCVESQKVQLISSLMDMSSWNLVVTFSDIRARELCDDFKNFTDDVWVYPAKDLLFYNADVHGSVITSQRINVLAKLSENTGGVIITTVDGLMERLMPPKAFKDSVITLIEGEEADSEDIKKRLVLMGYEREAKVEQPGQFSVRGGILDIYPFTMENPVRIEFWGDDVDSIRIYDAESQRSIERVDAVDIYPASELVLAEDILEAGAAKIRKELESQIKLLKKDMKGEAADRLKFVTEEVVESLENGWRSGNAEGYLKYFYEANAGLIDYMNKKVQYFIDEPQRVAEKAAAVELEFNESMCNRLEKGVILPGQADMLFDTKYVFAKLCEGNCCQLSGLDFNEKRLPAKEKYNITVKSTGSYNGSFDMLLNDLKRWKKERYRVLLLSPVKSRAERLARELREYELLANFSEDCGRDIVPGEILVSCGKLHRGFEYPLIRYVVITESDMFGRDKKKTKYRKKSGLSGKKIQDFAELSVGDYVIHENHGLGIYKGIEKVKVEGIEKDYIKLEYGDGGKLYVPVTQMDIIQKYAVSEGKLPKLNKLGSTDWSKTRSKVKKAVADIAKDLVELYAKRQQTSGFVYGPDTVWQAEFEEMFPYEETEDQIEAINAVKKDMEGTKIMDRLVCGDVGYGKTEIAIRAAFKAVQEGKQVVYLVPTTVLAQQHFNTFTQRMMDFPVRIDLLSRFRSSAQQKKTIEDLSKGLVDIVIGTHRVLSKDVRYKDLGLLIIDEEQRFGVTHKEKIKKLKENVDVLTLTATPIPRTLHMSLIGIRDMSVLEEPPVDRVPIQTYVMEYNDEMVREAIVRELSRGGQVFYVYNRVKDIEEKAAKIAQMLPDANVVSAHGQMNERQLEAIMFDFINGDIDVLVSTTIIETGIDISNVNTMIIEDADRFGLSQLYQLRGRVGRSNRTAYAFMLYKRDKMLNEVAEKRLAAIREFSDLGSGVKIAMRDLEIRGAGNLLGAEQHGHMEAVGYDLYCKMLNEAVTELKGENKAEDFETIVDIDMNAYIPDRYIANEHLKLDMYKKISCVSGTEDLEDIQDELIDRFGDMPKEVENLIYAASIKAAAHELYITEIKANRREIRFTMFKSAKVVAERIPEVLKKHKGMLKVKPGSEPVFAYTHAGKSQMSLNEMLDKVKFLLNDIKFLLES